MLEGKIALVTGASRGIGRQIAKTLAAKGATVIVNYNGSAAKAEEAVQEIREAGGIAEAVQCNVSDFNSSKEMLDGIVAKYGRLDILVNNAGITRDNLVMKMSEEDFDAVIQTNLKGVFNLSLIHIDAADDLLCVDLGGRRIIKKQKYYTILQYHHMLMLTAFSGLII